MTNIASLDFISKIGYTSLKDIRREYVFANGSRAVSLGVLTKLPVKIFGKLLLITVTIFDHKDYTLLLGRKALREFKISTDWDSMNWFIKIEGEKRLLPVTYGTSYSIRKMIDFETEDVESETENSNSEEHSDEEGEYESYSLIQDEDNIKKIENNIITVEEIFDQQIKKIPDTNNLQMTQVQSLLQEYRDIFAIDYQGLNQTNLVECTIDTGDATPIRMKPYTLAHADREFVQTEIEKMVAEGILRPALSNWAFPIVVVKKKNGEKRLCGDFRKLNGITKRDTFPLPDITDLLESFIDAKIFSTLDLLKAFNQIGMANGSDNKVTLVTPFGTYSYRVMPFGITNGPATFSQRYILPIINL